MYFLFKSVFAHFCSSFCCLVIIPSASSRDDGGRQDLLDMLTSLNEVVTWWKNLLTIHGNWYIYLYLHLVDFIWYINVGKETIHGWYGVGLYM